MRNFRSGTPNLTDPLVRRRSVLYRSIGAAVAAFALVTAFPALSAAPKLNKAIEGMAAVNQAAAKSQQKINDLTSRTQDAAARYAQALAETKSYEQYAAKLNTQVQSQQQEMASINRQLQQIEVTRRGILPLMGKMVQSLAHFVALDVPFLPKERTQRMSDLKDLMSRADVSISEKYRILLQDYLTELDYGRTLGTYDGRLGTGKDARAVHFVRIGRVSLMYQTLDGSQTGYWDNDQKKWVVDNAYAQAFKEAMKMANQRGTPQLLTVPVPAPQQAQQSAMQPTPQSAAQGGAS